MHAVMNTDFGIRVVDADEPSGAGVRLSVVSAGICGTDVNLVAAGISGFIYGHEFAGVDDSGTGYFVEPIVYGGKCGECRSGHTQRCAEPGNTTLGIFSDGGMAETVVVPEYSLLALPAQLDVKDACLIEPAAIAWHGVRRAQVQPGKRFLVVGGGSIGLLALRQPATRDSTLTWMPGTTTNSRQRSGWDPAGPAAITTWCSTRQAASRAWPGRRRPPGREAGSSPSIPV